MTHIHGAIALSASVLYVNPLLDIYSQFLPSYGLLFHSTSLLSSLDVKEARNLVGNSSNRRHLSLQLKLAQGNSLGNLIYFRNYIFFIDM